MIDKFRDEYFFLSNFYGCDVTGIDGLQYPSVEHAFQAAKCLDAEKRKGFRVVRSCAEAKKLGRSIKLRPDWEDIKYDVMETLVRNKFKGNKYLADKLVATGDEELVEGNNHKDTIWGVYRGSGENRLGKILMKIRKECING